jgi:hypothetical protein
MQTSRSQAEPENEEKLWKRESAHKISISAYLMLFSHRGGFACPGGSVPTKSRQRAGLTLRISVAIIDPGLRERGERQADRLAPPNRRTFELTTDVAGLTTTHGRAHLST